MRRLATIQKVTEVSPIEGADAIEKARVLGWTVVVKKDEFRPGDLCVYCEIDSVMPDKPEFEFLKPRKMRIRTVRLRGQISQGICFPLSTLPPGTPAEEGADITEALGVTKFEPPIPAHLQGIMKGSFPGFIPKTDETRVQVLQDLLTKYKGQSFYMTEKIDGSSVTYYIKDGVFGVCSRNLELLESEENTLWKLAREMSLSDKLAAAGVNCALQGEVIGEGVQGNKYKLKGQSVRFFNYYDIGTRSYASFTEFRERMTALGLQPVPLLSENLPLPGTVDELVQLSTGKSVLYPDIMREGIVLRPLKETSEEEVCRGLLPSDRVSFKVVNPEFLLKYGE